MTKEDMGQNVSRIVDRRNLLRALGGAGVVTIAGCVGVDENGEGVEDDVDEDEEAAEDDDVDDDDEAEQVYEIGMVDSLTGALADFGERNQRGMELAMETVNSVGVADGELDIIVEDSESTAENGVAAAQKLVEQDGVPFLIGAVGSGVSLAIYDSVVANTDVVQLSQNSTGLGLTEQPGLLRMSPSGRAQSLALADIITEDGYDEVAVTYINDDFGESLADAFVDAYDGDVLYNNPHDGEQASYTGILSEMNATDAEAWLFITYQEEFATQVTEMFEAGYDPVLYGADSNRGDTVRENTPEGAMDGMKVVEPSAPVEQENYQEFATRFEDEYGEEPTAWSAFTYDCVITAALSIETAEEFSAESLGEVVRDVTRSPGEEVYYYEDAIDVLEGGGNAEAVNYNGVSGPINFDENGDPTGALQVFEVQDHEYVPIEFREG